MLQAGAGIREDPNHEEAWAVARETMRRARQNIEMLVERLRKLGYRFENPDAVHIPPPLDAAQRVDELEWLIGGAVPLSLRAWWEEVGEVSLVGSDRALAFRADPASGELPQAYADPLALDGVDRGLAECREMTQHVEGVGQTPFRLALAPDWYHKANVSGGVYATTLPNPAADALLEGEPHGTTLVGYLRVAFTWGGFPGWSRSSYMDRRPFQEIRYLAHGLLPI
jgi:hypothetical protein